MKPGTPAGGGWKGRFVEEQGIDLRAYWRILQRWWWVLVLGALGGVMGAYFLIEEPPPIYEATTKVLVEGNQRPGTPSLADIQTNRQLAQTYTDLILTRGIMEQVVEKLDLPYGPGALSGKIKVDSPRSLLQIKARDADPVRAAQIANTTAEIFIDDQQNRQLTQIAQFQASLGLYGINQDPSIISAQIATLSTLSILEDALPPSARSNPQNKRQDMILAGAVGLFVAVIIVFVLEYLDDIVKSPDELKAITGLTPLAGVLHAHGRNNLRPITLEDEHQNSTIAESYKFLSTNLEFAAQDTPELKSLLVTSSSPAEGKTTIAANLAISTAREGKSVVLVDSDLRRPALHKVFDLDNREGLTNALMGNATLQEVLFPTSLSMLRVLPAGLLPPDPTLILRSPNMKKLLNELEAMSDLVILDSPPLLAVTDPLILASLVDGVLMVVDAHKTRREPVRRAVDSLKQGDQFILGAVLNKIRARGRGDYYYYYHREYSQPEPTVEKESNGKFPSLPRLFGSARKKR